MRATKSFITPHNEESEKLVSIEQIPKGSRVEFRLFEEKTGASDDFLMKLPKNDNGIGFRKILGQFYWVSVIHPNGVKLSRELLRLEMGACVVKVLGQAQRVVHEYDAEKCFDASSILLPTSGESTCSANRKFSKARGIAVKVINDPKYADAFGIIKTGTLEEDKAIFMYVEDAPIALERKVLRIMNTIERIYGNIQLNNSIETMLRYVEKNKIYLRK